MNGPELTAKILQLLQLTRTRPGMIFGSSQPGYEQVAYYFEGYLDGIGLVTGRILYHNIRCWHMQQKKQPFPNSWHRHIQLTHNDASESELIKLLVDGIESYFKQNPDWQEEDIPLRIWFDEEDDENRD